MISPLKSNNLIIIPIAVKSNSKQEKREALHLPQLVEKSVFIKWSKFSNPNPKPLPTGKGLSVGLPPSPRLVLRPKPHFKKSYSFFNRLQEVNVPPFLPFNLHGGQECCSPRDVPLPVKPSVLYSGTVMPQEPPMLLSFGTLPRNVQAYRNRH